MHTFKHAGELSHRQKNKLIEGLMAVIVVLHANQKPNSGKRSRDGFYFNLEERREVIKAYVSGMSGRKVGRKFKVSCTVPGAWAKQEGFLARKPGKPNTKVNRQINTHNELRLRKLAW